MGQFDNIDLRPNLGWRVKQHLLGMVDSINEMIENKEVSPDNTISELLTLLENKVGKW